jgi:hypothetical protein
LWLSACTSWTHSWKKSHSFLTFMSHKNFHSSLDLQAIWTQFSNNSHRWILSNC